MRYLHKSILDNGKDNGKVHRKISVNIQKKRGLLDTTTGDASPWSILARFNGRRKTITFDACFLTEGDASLKQLINGGLDNTTVTAVLIGTDTYSRRWVRYEIFKSLDRGNKLLGIHINSVPCKNKQTKNHGPNPFEYLAVKFNAQGDRVDFCEWDGQKWIPYTDVAGWKLTTAQSENANATKQLSNWYKTYCWVANSGYQNFGTWVEG